MAHQTASAIWRRQVALQETFEYRLRMCRHLTGGNRHCVAEESHPRAKQLLEGFLEDGVVVAILQNNTRLQRRPTNTQTSNIRCSYCILHGSSSREVAAQRGELREEPSEDVSRELEEDGDRKEEREVVERVGDAQDFVTSWRVSETN